MWKILQLDSSYLGRKNLDEIMQKKISTAHPVSLLSTYREYLFLCLYFFYNISKSNTKAKLKKYKSRFLKLADLGNRCLRSLRDFQKKFLWISTENTSKYTCRWKIKRRKHFFLWPERWWEYDSFKETFYSYRIFDNERKISI